MKQFILFARLYMCFTLGFSLVSSAQEPLTSFPNYVVIGAFAHQRNAIHFAKDANKRQFPAKFEMNPNRNLYYVYVLATSDRERAFAEALKLRTETKYFDTWVYSGALGKEGLALQNRTSGGDFNPETRSQLSTINTDQQETHPNDPAGATGKIAPTGTNTLSQKSGENTESGEELTRQQENADGQSLVERRAQISANVNSTEGATRNEDTAAIDDAKNVEGARDADSKAKKDLGPPPIRVTSEPLSTEEVEGKDFYFYLFRADNHAMVDGEVEAIDFERSRKMATYQGNAPVKVAIPTGKTKQVSFVCQVFGYRKQQVEFNPNDPADLFYLDDNGNLVVPFELVRLQKGDIAIMYNVFFFKDAAVMRPESRYEVNNLLDLLLENPSYKIMLHGHTNGNASGKIIRRGESENFYSLTDTKQGYGSAKALSEERANVIRAYLVSSGIAPDRMQVKAWGGRKPIHDKHSVRANENVRVEVEILSD